MLTSVREVTRFLLDKMPTAGLWRNKLNDFLNHTFTQRRAAIAHYHNSTKYCMSTYSELAVVQRIFLL